MDYNKSGAAKAGKNAPRHSEHNAYGTNKKPFGARPTKQDLLARMKKAGQPDKTEAGRANRWIFPPIPPTISPSTRRTENPCAVPKISTVEPVITVSP